MRRSLLEVLPHLPTCNVLHVAWRQAEPWKGYFSAVGKEVKSLQERLVAAQQQITDLRQQLAASQVQQPAPTSAPAPTAAEIAEVTVRALAAALTVGHQ